MADELFFKTMFPSNYAKGVHNASDYECDKRQTGLGFESENYFLLFSFTNFKDKELFYCFSRAFYAQEVLEQL